MPGRGRRAGIPPGRPAHRRASRLGRGRRPARGRHGRRERLGGLARRPAFDRSRPGDPGHRLLRGPDSRPRALPVPILRGRRDPAGRLMALDHCLRRPGGGQYREPDGRAGRIQGHSHHRRLAGRPADPRRHVLQVRGVGRAHLADRALRSRDGDRVPVGSRPDENSRRPGPGLGGGSGRQQAATGPQAAVGPDVHGAAAPFSRVGTGEQAARTLGRRRSRSACRIDAGRRRDARVGRGGRRGGGPGARPGLRRVGRAAPGVRPRRGDVRLALAQPPLDDAGSLGFARDRTARPVRQARPLGRGRPGRGDHLDADVSPRRAGPDALRRGLPRPHRDRVPAGLALRHPPRHL